MTEETVVIFDNGSGLTLEARGQPGGDAFKVANLLLSTETASGGLAQRLGVGAGFDIPRKLLGESGGRLIFLSKDKLQGLAQEEWAALRERLRRRLAQPFDVSFEGTDTLFGLRSIAGAKIEARLWLVPEILDGPDGFHDDDRVFRAEATAELVLDLKLTAGPAASLMGRWRVDIEVRKAAIEEAVSAVLEFEIPALPALDLDWPRFSLPALSFSGCSFPSFGRMPSLFATALPPIGARVSFVSDLPLPAIEIGLTDSDLSVATAAGQSAGGTLAYDGQVFCAVNGATFTYDGASGRHGFAATLIPTDIEIEAVGIEAPLPGGPDLPFNVAIASLSTTITFGEIVIGSAPGASVPDISLTHVMKALKIAARDDPSLFVVLDLAFRTSVQPEGGIGTELTELKLVEPFPLILVETVAASAVRAGGELIRLIAAIPLPQSGLPGIDAEKLGRLFALLGRLSASAMAWLARRAGGAGLLAGPVEAVVKLLDRFLDGVAGYAASFFRVVCVEVRLDPRTYRLRQIVLTPASDGVMDGSIQLSALGFDLIVDARLKPSLMIDCGPESWFGLVVEPSQGASATLKTDLWLDKETGPQQPLGTLDAEDGGSSSGGERLIELIATPRRSADGEAERRSDIVVVAVQHGRLRLFQKFVTFGADRSDTVEIETGTATFVILSKHQSGTLQNASIGSDATADDIVLTCQSGSVEKRILALLPKSGSDRTGDGFADLLSQKIQIDSAAIAWDDKHKDRVNLEIDVTVHLGANFAPQTVLLIGIDLHDLSMRIGGGDRISIRGKETRHYQPLGFDLEIGKKKDASLGPDGRYEEFLLDLSSGGERLELGRDAETLLSYDRVASAGKGLRFTLSTLAIGRSGIDIEARIKPDPVRLGGVDMPFTFTSGQVSIKGSRFAGGSLIGSGQLPKKLIGEANASIALTLGRGPSGEDVVVEAATALIDKSGDPVRCHSTRFDVTITELGFSFVMEESYHFYFLVTGSARFKPEKTPLARGLLKNFGATEIRFDKAPLTSDPRVLMRSISFLVKLKPPTVIRLFDIFKFELRAIAFYPAAEKFGGQAAMGFGGQVNFLDHGDRVSAKVDFHELLIGPPKAGDVLPRIRFDGLGVAISLSGVKIGGTAITVDGDLPSLYRPNILPKNISAHGFLASGALEVRGWAPMSATLGFLELKNRDNPADGPRHAFFVYGQMNRMSEPIDTPIGTIYLREVGFGFGYRYTLGGIAQAKGAETPQDLVRILDEVSKIQGSLDRFEAWEPTYDNADLTLALRGMLALSAAQRSSSEYDEKTEATLPNPLLFDIVAALRTDMTILINLRAWLCVNYHKWATDSADVDWKRNPVFRGYLYFSAPKREFLGRFISNRNGYIGEHPPLPEALKTAIQSTDFSATLYIRPGLFHFELGWPYELGFELGKPGERFFLKIRGGLIQRVEDFSVLQGIAFKAYGEVHLEGRIGSSSFGAAAVAHATFDIEARVLSYLSLRNFDESMYYGTLRIDIMIDARIEVWLSFNLFGKRIRLSAGFSLQLAVSLAIEAVISPSGLGGKAHAAVGIRAFGRTASVGIGFSFNDGLLNLARARVAGFMALGLTTSVPDRSQDGRQVERNPPPEPPRHETAAIADEAIDHDLGSAPAPEADAPALVGRAITETNFWAMLFPTSYSRETGEWYVMQLVPRDHTPCDEDETFEDLRACASFFASPTTTDGSSPWHALATDTLLPDGLLHLSLAGIAAPAIGNHPYGTATAEIVDAVAEVTLGALLGDLFLDPDVHGNPTEPDPRNVSTLDSRLGDDARASVATLARHGRSRIDLPAKRRREAQVEEARSAILASVIDSAARLAGEGVTAAALPARHAQIDARDFGLTFLVSRAALRTLFPDLVAAEADGDVAEPPEAVFLVQKSDTADAGTVHLFNPPSRMFREAQPRFTPKHVIAEQGIMLDWDLEPSWGSSRGAYHDPEFHLRHYRVRRTIRGLSKGGEYRADFIVKAAAPTKLSTDDPDVCTVTMLRPPFQFIDDLRQVGVGPGTSAIPDALRAALLGKERHEDLTGQVDILYEIVPVDIAGTSDFGEPYVVPIVGAPDLLPVSPRQAVLQLSYPPLGSSLAPQLRFLLTPHPGQDALVLHLRILTERIEALGTYGTDAIDQAGRFDERSIERLKGADVAEFVITLRPVATSGPFVFQNQDRDLDTSAEAKQTFAGSEESKNLDPVFFDGTIHMLKDGKLVASNLSGILNALDADDHNVVPGLARHLFLRRLAGAVTGPKELHQADKHGEWRSMPVNLVLARERRRRVGGFKPQEQDRPAPISTILESFEQPLDLSFMALSTANGDAGAESGRLHLVYPRADGTLDDLAENALQPSEGGRRTKAFETVRDPARRTATRLNWKVNAAHLKRVDVDGADDAELYRWVGGYDVHVVDPDALPTLPPKASDDEIRTQLADAAKPVGRVAMMPAAFDGLEPSGFGDFGRLESAYPSETLRLIHPPKGARASGVRRAGWYSPAESTAIFPQPSLRRSLMPDPDEVLIASLFVHGRPEALRISIPAWIETSADPLPDWRIAVTGQHEGGLGEFDDASAPTDHEQAAKMARYEAAEGIKVAEVRQILQNLCLVPAHVELAGDEPQPAMLQEAAALRRRVDDPTHLAGVIVRVEALRARRDASNRATTDWVLVASRDHVVDLSPRLHPVLADALAFLPYAPQRGTAAEVADGSIYRRYSVVVDADPEVKATTFANWLDEQPPERDPYGWGSLRTLGLARGFRVYDSVTGDYLRGRKLLRRVRSAMTRALMRYRDAAGGSAMRFNGQPFVDLLTKPWGNAKLFWFDGGGESLDASEEARVVDNETLAVVQIALRPAPDRIARVVSPHVLWPVRYFAIKTGATGAERPEWNLKLTDPQPDTLPRMRLDILSLSGGIGANPAIRLGKGVVHAFRVSRLVPQSEPTIAVVRAIVLDTSSFGANQVRAAVVLELAETNTDGKITLRPVPFEVAEIAEPSVLEAISKISDDSVSGRLDLAPDPAFGRFETLDAADWADALFRPERDGDGPYRLSQVPAFEALAYHLARRFGRVTLSQGVPVARDPNHATTVEESEPARDARAELAAGVTRFWARFLDHCAPVAASHPDAIFYSIGTVAVPGVRRCAPDPDGTVSIVIPDAERRGARRKFAIRPFGRYESWITAQRAPGTGDEPPPGLDRALGPDFAEQFLDVTLPRTEPLEKPVILSAVRRWRGDIRREPGDPPEADDANDVGRIEIVVAHGTDMVMAQANRRNDAMFAPLAISVGYLREFPHSAWLSGLVADDADYDPLSGFGSEEPDANFAFPALGEEEAKAHLQELRKLVPDAWLGSTLISAATLPYFFRTHALVHTSAGIVVSQTTRAVFEEGFAELHLPFLTSEGYGPRTRSAIPTYEVTRDENGGIRIIFDLALHRFVDCMRPREAVLWFGESGDKWGGIRRVAHLPEPGISYRISIDASIRGTSEVISRVTEFDLLPSIPKAGESARYLVQSTGHFLKVAGHVDGQPDAVEPLHADDDWRLPLVAVLHDDGAVRSFSRQVEGDVLAALHARLQSIVETEDSGVLMVDCVRHHVVTATLLPAETDWDVLLDKALETLGSAPEASDILRQWREPPQQGATLTLPLSYAAIHRFQALDHLRELCGSEPMASAQELLLIRTAPTDAELEPFGPGAAPTPADTDLWTLLLRMAAEQLFGPDRQPVVTAAKGTMTPLHHPIVRWVEERPS